MDIGTLRGLGTVLVFVAFIGVLIWAFSNKRKNSFDDAANLPFADETDDRKREDKDSRSKSE